nr:immunoglobulin heavy chain junction region [Macaca mulatta]
CVRLDKTIGLDYW